jgi:hypothetical protein
MLRRTIIALGAIAIFMSVTALAGPKTGCKKFNFTGSFLAADPAFDVFGDGSAIHSFALQLTLNSDGSANQYWTGLPDYTLNLGTASHQIGSWTCRDDGKLIINLIQGTYFPVEPNTNTNVSGQDIELVGHYRTTYLFSVDDDNTLTRMQSRTRSYQVNEDPTNATTAGHLLPLRTTTTTYRRLVATDTDLTAP